MYFNKSTLAKENFQPSHDPSRKLKTLKARKSSKLSLSLSEEGKAEIIREQQWRRVKRTVTLIKCQGTAQ